MTGRLTSPSILHAFLSSIDAKAQKRLSQNFLIDQNIVQKILQAAEIRPGDTVLEIGPGPGALTEALLEKGAFVIAVEKDRRFAQALKRFEDVEVHCGDILQIPLESLIGQRKVKVVANLPYSITTPILAYLLPRGDLFSSLTVMVQEEVARRMVAQPKTKDYSSLTVFLQCYCTPVYCFKVSNRCFFPVPKVQSAVVHLKLEAKDVDEGFFSFIRASFGKRRKTLKAALKGIFDISKLPVVLESLNIDLKIRAEELSFGQLYQIYSCLKQL